MAGVPIVSFKNMLTGDNAFYKQQGYIKNTMEDLSRYKALPPSYVVEFESKIVRIAKFIFSLILFPIFLYNVLHNLFGRLVYPANFIAPSQKFDHPDYGKLNLDGEWKYKRLTVEVDGCLVDATLMGTESTLGNGRFVLQTVGNCESYNLHNPDFKKFLTNIKGNALLVDVPGVGASTGGPNRTMMAKTYQAMLTFLEDKNGLAAREIIGYGLSIGAGCQAEGLLNYPLDNQIDYLFIKDRPFRAVAAVPNWIIGLAVKIFGWNQSTLESSIELKAKEIIIQKADISAIPHDLNAAVIEDGSLIQDDGVIGAPASLGKALLDRNVLYPNKLFIGTSLDHNDGFIDPKFLAGLVNNLMKKSAKNLV